MPRGQSGPPPTSCESCRSKKLKCSRKQPCTNCSARGLTCAFAKSSTALSVEGSIHQKDNELLDRIKRLENTVRSQQAKISQQRAPEHYDARGISENTPDLAPSYKHHQPEEDSQLLENLATRKDSLLPDLSDHGIAYEICDLPELLEASAGPTYKERELARLSYYDKRVRFPPYVIATQLLRSYESTVDQMCRILHIPTVRIRMRNLYECIMRGETVETGEAALFLSIFAIAAFFYTSADNPESALLKLSAFRLSKAFSRSALDSLDHSRRNTSGTLEDVQAYTLMSLLAFQLDGFSARGRMLLMAALSFARDLRLHRTDAKPIINERMSPREVIDNEVRRRLFWYIVATDWLLSAIAGPQEGTYFLRSDQIRVRLPRNCTDDEVLLTAEDSPSDRQSPTAMAYFLQRVQLANLCRDVIDSMPIETEALLQMPYERILALDQKFLEFLENLPVFFKQDTESLEKARPLEVLHPQIPLWRYSIIQALHSRRCKLHQKFIFRQSIDSRYAYSRRACIESALAVIRSDQDVVCPDPPWIATARRGIATHFKHLAMVILVLDLCFNPNGTDEAEIKAEVKATLEAFEGARHVSPLLGHFLDSIYQALRKHEVELGGLLGTKSVRIANHALNTDFEAIRSLDHNQSRSPVALEEYSMSFTDISFEDFWQATFEEDGSGLDPSAWDDLFSRLDSQPL